MFKEDYLVFDKHTYEILYQVVKVKTRKHKKGYRMKRQPYYQNTFHFSGEVIDSGFNIIDEDLTKGDIKGKPIKGAGG